MAQLPPCRPVIRRLRTSPLPAIGIAPLVSMPRRPLITTAAALYPIVTIIVIFSTAGHYLLDVVAGALAMTFALFVGLILHLRENGVRPAKDHEVTNKTTIVESPGGSI